MGYDNQKGFVTEEYEIKRIACGTIPTAGITFYLKAMDTLEGKFGQFWRITGIANKGAKNELEFVIDFSSEKLHALMSKNLDVLLNNYIKLIGRGKKFERQYSIFIIEPPFQVQDINEINELVNLSKTAEP